MKTMKLFPIIFIAALFSCEEEPEPMEGFKLSMSSIPEEAGKINYWPWQSLYRKGQSVTLTPESNENWVFQKWEGDLSGNSSPLELEMDSDKRVVAVFVKRNFALDYTIIGEGTVTEKVVENPSGREYPVGSTVELTAIPKEGWVFESWRDESSNSYQISVDNPRRIIIEGPKTITVRFIQKPPGDPKFFLAENGITCKCENVFVGQKGTINGIEYQAVNNELLRQRVRDEIDVSKLCTSLVTDMSFLFYTVSINQPIGNWDVSNVTTMEGMFAAYQELWGWDIPSQEAILFDQPIGDWDVSNVTNMDYMFKDNFVFNQDLSKWCVIKIPQPPKDFLTEGFTLPKPVWGTCPD